MKKRILRNFFIYVFALLFITLPGAVYSVDLLQPEGVEADKTGINVQSAPAVSGKSAIVFNKINGEVLYEKDIHTRCPNGSISKLMTAIVAVERGNLDDIVTVSSYAVSMRPTSAGLRAGEKLTLEELIYAMILPSGNDAATAIAQHVGGTEANFVSMMNSKAKKIGTRNTRYNNPRGSDGSTPYDLALIASYALDNEFLAEVLSTRRIEIPGPTQGETRTYNNVNIRRLLRIFPEANGVKWGLTTCSGHCFIGSATRDERYIITVVMDAPDYLEDTKKLLEYGFERTYVPVTSVELDRKEVIMEPGEAFYLNPAVKPSNASNQRVRWSADNPDVVEVTWYGRVEALDYGEAVITAITDCGSKTAACVILVQYTKVESVELYPDYAELATGESIDLAYTIYPEEASDKTVTWSSDNPDVATVNNGRVTVLDVGETVITVTTGCGGIIAQCFISVPYIAPESVIINKESLDLKLKGVGSSRRLLAEVWPVNTSYRDVTWHSDDSSVVSVNSNGIITAEGPGEAVITVETVDGNKTDTCIVTVNDDNIIYGDVNGDGVICVRDVIALLRYIVGLIPLDDDALKASDVSGDNKVDVEDAINILRYIVGLY